MLPRVVYVNVNNLVVSAVTAVTLTVQQMLTYLHLGIVSCDLLSPDTSTVCLPHALLETS